MLRMTLDISLDDNGVVEATFSSPEVGGGIQIGCRRVSLRCFLVGLGLLGLTETVQKRVEEVIGVDIA